MHMHNRQTDRHTTYMHAQQTDRHTTHPHAHICKEKEHPKIYYLEGTDLF